MNLKTQTTLAALGTLALAMALAACSNTPAHNATTTTSTTTSSTVPQTTTSSTAASTSCAPSQLHVTEYGSGGAAGTIELTFSLTDTSGETCTMHGYPGMQLLNSSGGSVATIVNRGGGLAFENVPVSVVSLDPGQTAYFNVGYSDVTQGTTSCSVATGVEITPPNDYSFATVTVPEINACGGGTLDVSPIFSSTDSAATSTTAPPVS